MKGLRSEAQKARAQSEIMRRTGRGVMSKTKLGLLTAGGSLLGAAGGAFAGGAGGAVLGSAAGPIGSLIGAITGLITGGAAGAYGGGGLTNLIAGAGRRSLLRRTNNVKDEFGSLSYRDTNGDVNFLLIEKLRSFAQEKYGIFMGVRNERQFKRLIQEIRIRRLREESFRRRLERGKQRADRRNRVFNRQAELDEIRKRSDEVFGGKGETRTSKEIPVISFNEYKTLDINGLRKMTAVPVLVMNSK
jgi:hypothetical protein